MFLGLIRGRRKDLWTKCQKCNEFIYKRDFEENLWVCPRCGYHTRLPAKQRIELTVDPDSFEELFSDIRSLDFLGFDEGYPEKLVAEAEKYGISEAVVVGRAKIGSYPVLIGVMDFRFRGGSMGSVVGERITRLFKLSAEEKLPVILFTASGGARMQEGVISLMQMVRTSQAVELVKEQGIMYICVMTDPTMAGVAASFASLADVIIAEPGALIGFTGPRVIRQTIRQELPKGFQSAEFCLEKGLIDMVVDRRELRTVLIKLINVHFSTRPRR